MAPRTLTQFMLDIGVRDGKSGLARILAATSVAIKLTASMVARGPLIMESTDDQIPSDEQLRRTLRRLATNALLKQTDSIEQLAGVSLAGSSKIQQVSASGRYLLVFEAMHGMTNLSDNLPVGAAFAVLERETSGPCTEEDFLQPGTNLCAAGVALYGPRTVLTLTTGNGVDCFTFDREVGNFVLTRPQVKIPLDRPIFAINPADAPHWPGAVKRYVEECVLGAEGPRGRDFVMRWNASALVGAYRVLTSGGLFLVPETDKPGTWLAPLLHTAAPLAFLAEQAGGAAVTGTQRVLEVVPESLNTRVPLFLGCVGEVDRISRYFEEEQDADREYAHPLFHNRTLFVD
ncbi:MAG: fructose-1,6-bisphosphatase [Propionibacterium sp.]|nr:fructose-1,6-bisphosphatase [Propionibacterium sp.]